MPRQPQKRGYGFNKSLTRFRYNRNFRQLICPDCNKRMDILNHEWWHNGFHIHTRCSICGYENPGAFIMVYTPDIMANERITEWPEYKEIMAHRRLNYIKDQVGYEINLERFQHRLFYEVIQEMVEV